MSKLNTVIVGVICFGAGLLVGSFYQKNKSDVEVESVITEFKKEREKYIAEHEAKTESKVNEAIEQVISEYKSTTGGQNITAKTDPEYLQIVPAYEAGYFVDEDGVPFDTETLSYYADGVVAYSNNNVLTNIGEYIGYRCFDLLRDTDEVCVRNFKAMRDISIIKVNKNFSDIIKKDEE